MARRAADPAAPHGRTRGARCSPAPPAKRSPTPARRRPAPPDRGGWARHGPPDLAGEDGLDPACLAALRSCTRPGTGDRRQRPRADPARPPLSSRELEGLRLLADGASNPDISKTLYISRRTSEHHVEHTLRKLAVPSRAAAVAYALTHELLS